MDDPGIRAWCQRQTDGDSDQQPADCMPRGWVTKDDKWLCIGVLPVFPFTGDR